MSYNENLYKKFLDAYNVENMHDRKLLANKLSKAYKDKSCCDNFRLCFSDESKNKTSEYIEALNSGCCGFYDEFITNPLTNNSYWIGFNYGH